MRYIRSGMILFTVVVVAFAFTYAVEARDKQYTAKQVGNFVVDGNLDEWGIVDAVIVLDELKDTGAALPDPEDFSGEVMVGWSSNDPERVYLAYIVIDDELQDINPPNTNWWNDDTAEIIFDFNNDATRTKWGIGAGGELGADATDANTEYVIVFNEAKNQYIFEIAITGIQGFRVDAGTIVGLSPIYDDGENGVREHQVGWIAGAANDSNNMGDIIFSAEMRTPTAVEPGDKLATAWGALKN